MTTHRETPVSRNVRHPIAGVTYRSDDEVAAFVSEGLWAPATYREALRKTARLFPSREAAVGPGVRLTWSDLDQRSDHLARGFLESGLGPGDRVLIQLGTDPLTVLVFAALFKAGIIPVCAVPQYRDYEMGALCGRSAAVAHLIQPTPDLLALSLRLRSAHSHLKHTFVLQEGIAETRSIAEIEGAGSRSSASLDRVAPRVGDLMSFQLSGGTTGVPKIIPRFHGEYLGYAEALARRIELAETDRFLWSLPLSHNAGMILVLVPCTLTGAAMVLLPKFEAETFLELASSERVTIAGSVGPITPRLLALRDVTRFDLSSLRYFFTLNQARDLEDHLGVTCANIYGTTEGILIASRPDAPPSVRHGTLGTPVSPGDEISLLDTASAAPVGPIAIGEMVFRGPSQLQGYYRDAEATSRALSVPGWVRSGDLMAAHNIEGTVCFSFEGRIGENIDRGGEKFGTEELEGLIGMYPSIDGCAVVGMPDSVLGERVCAYVIITPGSQAPAIEELGAFLLSRGLAKFKLPERIEVLGEFPVTPAGKLDRRALRAHIRDKLSAEQATTQHAP